MYEPAAPPVTMTSDQWQMSCSARHVRLWIGMTSTTRAEVRTASLSDLTPWWCDVHSAYEGASVRSGGRSSTRTPWQRESRPWSAHSCALEQAISLLPSPARQRSFGNVLWSEARFCASAFPVRTYNPTDLITRAYSLSPRCYRHCGS